MTSAERMVFNSQVKLEDQDVQAAGDSAYQAMITAAKALVQIQYDDVTGDPDEVVEEFKDRYFDTNVFLDPFAGPKFANYFFAAHQSAGREFSDDSAHVLIEEAQLFIEAVHTCYNKIRTEGIETTGASK
jgi:sulfite reductase (ferredoxin)